MASHLLGWRDIPEPLLINILSYCSILDISSAAKACQRWRQISLSNYLWRGLLVAHFGLRDKKIKIKYDDTSWKEEYRRLYYYVPNICTQKIEEHSDEVLHVSFSNSGDRFVTCSKDGSIIVWRFNTTMEACLEFKEDMRKYGWKYTWSSKFNKTDSLLLAAGVQNAINGEIAVFKVNGTSYEILCKVANHPYDVMGDWVSDFHFFSGRLMPLDDPAFPENSHANLYMCEADPSLPPDINNPMSSNVMKNIVLSLVFNEQNSGYMRYLYVTDRSIFHPNNILKINERSEMDGPNEEQISNPGCYDALDQKDVCLISITNSGTLAPHRLSFCKIGPENTERIIKIRQPDKSLDMKGHIVGMSVSRDSKLLYVNVRRWPENAVLSMFDAPVIAQEIEMKIVDLETLTLKETILSGHKAYTDSMSAFYIYIDVSEDFVGSGSEDGRGRVWDRYYGCVVSTMDHEECVSSVAFNPRNQQIAISVSDDHKVKVWKSKSLIKELRQKFAFGELD